MDTAVSATPPETHDEVVDPCRADGRSHSSHEPPRRTTHMTIEYDGVYVDLVSGHCPGCDQVLVTVLAGAEDDPHPRQGCWTAIACIAGGTRRPR